MSQYVLRRIVLILPLTFAVASLVFIIFYVAPGDPAEIVAGENATTEDIQRIRENMGLTDPFLTQYGRFLKELAQGNLGESLITHQPVQEVIINRLPATVQLALVATVISVTIGITAGIVSALRRNSILDHLSMTMAVAFYCLPNFWIALLLILLFSVELQWLPSIGSQGLDPRYFILPALALAAPMIAIIARLTRSGMLEVLGDEFVVTARAKGLRERSVILRHTLPNVLVPVVTIVGLQIGGLLGGTVVVETIFSWPGMGWLLFTAVNQRDYPMLQAIVIVYSVVFMLTTLLVDIVYSYLDPRVRYD